MPQFLEWYKLNIDGIKLVIRMPDEPLGGKMLSREQYEYLYKNKIKATLRFTDNFIIWGEKFNPHSHLKNSVAVSKLKGYISVSHPVLNTNMWGALIYAYIDFQPVFNLLLLQGSAIQLIEILLHDDRVYEGQIVRLVNTTVTSILIGLAIQLWEKKKIYIDMDTRKLFNIDREMLEKYHNYKPLI